MNEEFDEALDKLHFIAISAAEFCTTTEQRNLRDLIKVMDASKLTYSLWLVPLNWKTAYKIKQYAPQVEGAQEIAFFRFQNGRKVK